MIGWLWRMIVGRFSYCDHHWVTVKTAPLTYNGHYVRDQYTLRCDKCGDIKARSI